MRIVNAFILVLLTASAALAETRLVMIEQPGCIYCERWDEEIAPIWPKTAEGRAAPLRRVDLRDLPPDLDFTSHPRLTPTFVLTIDGVETARLVGYTGDEFFWFLARDMLIEAGVELEDAGAALEE